MQTIILIIINMITEVINNNIIILIIISNHKIFSTKLLLSEKSSILIQYSIMSLDCPLNLITSQNHRMVWVGRDLEDRLVPTPLPWAGTLQVTGTQKISKADWLG